MSPLLARRGDMRNSAIRFASRIQFARRIPGSVRTRVGDIVLHPIALLGAWSADTRWNNGRRARKGVVARICASERLLTPSLCPEAKIRIAPLCALHAYRRRIVDLETDHARSRLCRPRRLSVRADGPLRARLRAPLKRERTMFEPIIGLSVAVLLGAYLVYTLLHPEKF
ncbi:K(+)-transporting ATPase subunit F [Methylosinus sp. Sm6]|nr:K(+)-transporting ATPase subunit F [Methylosinus sp. Sm6]